ncbi:MAG TPA: translocation/assembly module TamB domain-containing protein, partial [Myxococcales bacterium]|nr:translocation/assembly module TamB domain-containing protein [Myxococcales bacterium]
ALASGLWIEHLGISGLSLGWKVAEEAAARPKPSFALPAPCWVRLLRLVHVERLDVAAGPIRIEDEGAAGTLETLTARAHLDHGVYRGTVETSGKVLLGQAGARDLPIRRLSGSFALDPKHDVLSVTSAGVETDTFRASASGQLARLCHPVPDLTFSLDTSVPELAAWLAPAAVGAKGAVTVAGRWRGGSNVALDLRFSGAELEGYRLGDAFAQLALDDRGLRIDALKLALDEGGEVDGHGRLDLGGRLPITLELQVKNGDLPRTLDRAKIVHCLVDLKFDGTARVSGHLLGGALLKGELEGDVRGLVVNDFGWDRPVVRQRLLTEPERLHVTSPIVIDGQRFHFEHAHIRGGDTDITADAAIYYDARRGLRLEAKARQLSLAEFGTIAGIPWAGRGTASVTITGPYASPLIEGHADLDGFRFFRLDLGHISSDVRSQGAVLAFPILFGQRGRTGYSGSGSIDFDRDLWTEGDLDVPSGRLEDLTAAIQNLDAALPAVHEAFAGVFSGHGHVRGPLLGADASADLDLGDFTVYGRQLGQGAISAHLEKGRRIVLDSFTAGVGAGRISGEGTVSVDGTLDLRGRAEGVPIGPLLAPDGSEPPATGRVSLAGTLTGTISEFLPAGTARLRDFVVLGVPLGSAALRFQTEGRLLQLQGSAGDEETIRATLRLENRGPYTALVAGSTSHLETYLEGFGFHDPPAGALTGTLALHGDILDPERSEGEFDVSQLSLSRRALRIENEGDLLVGLSGSALDVRHAVLRGTNTHFELSGTRDADGQLHAGVSGELDARLLEGLVPHVERLGGVLEAHAGLRGTFADPSIIGTASFHDGEFLWSGWPLKVTNLEGSAEFSQRKLVLDRAHGQLNGAPAEISGEIRVRGFDVERCDLEATLTSVPLQIPEAIPSHVSGRVSLFGVVDDGLVMSGDLDVEWARYTRDLEIDQLLSAWRSHARVVPFRGREGGPPLRFDIRLHGDGDLRVDSDFAQLGLQGDLRLTGDSDSPGLLGSVTSKDGLVQFRGNQYRVTNASFTFADADRIAPVFDVTADSETRQYRVFVHAYGTPVDYKLSLRSQPELSEEDIVKLMTFGVTSRDTASSVGTAGDVGYLGDVLWNISGMQQQVKKIIPRNPLIKEFSFNVGSAFLEATGQVEPVAQIESKVLTDQLRLRAQLPLSVTTGNRVEAEYQLGTHLSLQGDWNNNYSDPSIGDIGDFGLDLRMRWEFGD